ncbi:hypothetical protein Nans01_05530 [Nocardiopsis ansamitocini]|uniref:D-alanyl-D-alanine carboxypeptidase-like core domain-containing protein n=1 Tax=Nocardiopsis ansamitocini TaxID=1670832 RepID=A0A9W6UGZ8_9ACTN|nr:hypothetical protein Nans01_05530 [Nocardiopsis ansamitocini]
MAAILGIWLAAVPGLPASASVPALNDVERSRQDEARHTESIESLKTDLALVRSRLDDLHADADAAILAYDEQQELLDEAEAAYSDAKESSDTASADHAASRREVARYAAAAYRGADLGQIDVWMGAEGPQEVVDRGGYVRLLADRRKVDLDRTRAAGLVGETMRDRARKAEQEREQAAEDAAEAKDIALEAVREQESQMESILAEQSEVEAALAAAQDNTAELEAERERALERARTASAPVALPEVDPLRDPHRQGDLSAGRQGRSAPEHLRETARATATENPRAGEKDRVGQSPAAPGDRSDTAPVAVCEGGALARYGNGAVPESALCPLPQTGEMLRADAAVAFIELDGAYRERFGQAMCVTDSYRPVSEQARLFREMPTGMAARPGNSTHGLGIAVDLCGGVNAHRSPQHEWMLANAPDFGWTNPEWARDGFEPWHWEFG